MIKDVMLNDLKWCNKIFQSSGGKVKMDGLRWTKHQLIVAQMNTKDSGAQSCAHVLKLPNYNTMTFGTLVCYQGVTVHVF